jgi:hypothetical protein
MFYAISWFLSFTLLALWSLACWGAHAVTVWAVGSAGALAGGTAAMDAVLLPEWLKLWIPPQLAQEFGGVVQAALATVPALSGAVSVLAWVIWGLGALTLVALAIGAHVLIALFNSRRNNPDMPRACSA